VVCGDDTEPARTGVKTFKPIGVMQLPEYPELRLLVPALLEVVSHVHEAGYTHLHLATPGPAGLAGLAAAKLLGLPVSGTYHTAFPQYAKALTEDSYAEDMTWKAMAWFYGQMDHVYVPSQATASELVAHGIPAEKIRVYPRGVDIERFSPAMDSGILQTRYGVPKDDLTFLYVGRVSREKNLHVLTEAYRMLLDKGVRARLVITGDGPYRAEMAAALRDMPVVFTGYLHGDDLTAVYAGSDVLVFPSTTDTFGNVVLEAQASGLPVIVTDQGGPVENMIHGETGMQVPANDAAALANAMAALASDAAAREHMGRAARAYIETRAFIKAFEQLYGLYVSTPTSPAAEASMAPAFPWPLPSEIGSAFPRANVS
jgi:glycosyltransferase involved in cell wall biosynthesis